MCSFFGASPIANKLFRILFHKVLNYDSCSIYDDLISKPIVHCRKNARKAFECLFGFLRAKIVGRNG